MSKISEQQIEHLAELSSLALTPEQTHKMQADLEQILTFVEKIESAQLENENIEERSVTLDELRSDEPKPSISNQKALQNAPKAENGYYVVSKVVE